MRPTKLVSTLALLAILGCHVGMSGAELPVATQPDGARVSLNTASGAYAGELLAVQDDGVIISSDRIMFAPFSAILDLRLERMGRQFHLGRADVPTGERLAQFRAVSRFPQGLTPNIRSVLLAQRSQAEIQVIQ
jgi:hypothetical protein